MKHFRLFKSFNLVFALLILALLIFVAEESFSAERNEIRIPDILGYVTLKCDFHMHTVFSDGSVWPTVRTDEVWREGLDAFSITDHIEYQPHKEDIPKKLSRAYDLAINQAKSLDLILIKGAEITRDFPPGHFNAIFITDVNQLDAPDFKQVIKSAVEQGGFVFWNHPPEKWSEIHEEMYNNHWLHGIEVVNGGRYYPHSHKWCIEKNLTLIGNSDVHGPINLKDGQHRPMTLVFAKERSEKAIKEALIEHRTAVYNGTDLIGDAKYLKALFDASVEVVNPNVIIKGKGSANVWIRNKSEVPVKLVLNGDVPDVTVPKEITLVQDKTVLLKVTGKSSDLIAKKEVKIPYKAVNFITAPNEYLPIDISLTIDFIK